MEEISWPIIMALTGYVDRNNNNFGEHIPYSKSNLYEIASRAWRVIKRPTQLIICHDYALYKGSHALDPICMMCGKIREVFIALNISLCVTQLPRFRVCGPCDAKIKRYIAQYQRAASRAIAMLRAKLLPELVALILSIT